MPPKRDSDQACEGLFFKSGVNVARFEVLTKGFIIRRNLAINLGTDFPDAVRNEHRDEHLPGLDNTCPAVLPCTP